MARDLNKVFIASGAGTAELTGKLHAQYSALDRRHLGASAMALPRQYWRGEATPGTSSPRITPSERIEANASEEITKLGGQVLGAARVPLGASDFSSFLLQAQSAKPKVIALANAGGDLTNTLKQAAEFGSDPQVPDAELCFQS